MSIRIAWPASPESDIASYALERAAAVSGPYLPLATVLHQVPGPYWDAGVGQFFYNDADGVETHYYRLVAVDAAGNRSQPSLPFQPAASQPAIPVQVRVDHNYPVPANLRYQTLGGIPIEGAVVRLFRKADFDAGRTETPVAITLTNAKGEWMSPVFLTGGYTYVVQVQKEGQYGPDRVEIVV